MKRMHRIYEALVAPWALHPAYIPIVRAGLQRLAAESDEEAPEQQEPVDPDDLVEGQVAVIPMRGIMLQHPGIYFAGGMPVFTEWWGQAFDELVADPEVAAIVIDQDTPGGIVYGTPELSDKIYNARGAKPILTVANALSASAGYWAGTAGDQFFVTPSGDVGSVGVYTMHMDWSKALAEFGIDVSFIFAGEFKVEGNWYEPLTDEAREELQRGVDLVHEKFLEAVARNRGVDIDRVRKDFGRGRTVEAERAVERGMADGVATLEEVIAEAARLAGVPLVPALEGRARAAEASGVEVRSLQAAAAVEGGDWPLAGLGVPYGRESANMGEGSGRPWREVFEPRAFSESVAAARQEDHRVIWQHKPECVLGRVRAGTARVWEDDAGVRYAAKPPATQWARDAMESIRRGDVDRSSFGFRIRKGGVRWESRDGYDLRIVSKAQLVELGPQTHPAYEDTSVAVQERAAWQQRKDAREIQEMLDQVGLLEAGL